MYSLTLRTLVCLTLALLVHACAPTHTPTLGTAFARINRSYATPTSVTDDVNRRNVTPTSVTDDVNRSNATPTSVTDDVNRSNPTPTSVTDDVNRSNVTPTSVTDDVNRSNATPNSVTDDVNRSNADSQVFDDEKEEFVSQGDIGGRNNTSSLLGEERTSTENAVDGEERSSVRQGKLNVSSGELKDISDGELTTSSPATTTSTSRSLAPSSSGSSATKPSPSSHSSVSTAFPPSRAPKEDSEPRQLGEIIKFFLNRIGFEQKFKSVVQILFFHIYIISFFYLFVVIHQGVTGVLDTLRTPLLIYKEVEDHEEVMGYPAPTMPPLHKDYGYTGGFKTPEGQEIEYMPYPAHKEEHHKPTDPPEPEEPPEPPKSEPKPAPMAEHVAPIPAGNGAPYRPINGPPIPAGSGAPFNGPPFGGGHGPPFGVFPVPPHVGAMGQPLMPAGEAVSSYVSYAGEQL